MALSKILENSITDGVVSSAKLKDFSAAVDLNGVELILDDDQDTSITADTDDRIDFKIANTDHISIGTSSGDTVIKQMTDAKDIKFQQYDGRTLLDINDSGFVGIANGATGAGAIRIFEDTDNGSNYVGLTAGSIGTSLTFTLPTADGSSGQFLKTDGSGALSFDTVSSAADDLTTGDAAVTIATSAGNITIDAQGNDTDIIFKGTDGGADKTFMTIDGSAGGDLFLTGGLIDLKNDGSNVSQIKFYCESSNAHYAMLQSAAHSAYSGNVTLTLPASTDTLVGKATTDTLTNKTLTTPTIDTINAGTFLIDASGDINLDAGGGDVRVKVGGTSIGEFNNSSSDFVIYTAVSDKDLLIKGNDGGSTITACTFDMSAAGAATFNNDVTAFSDARLKSNVETITDALDKVNSMRGVTFTRNDNNDQPGTGVIAQEMQEVFPVVVKENDDEDNTLSVSYGNLVGVLIESIKELSDKVDTLQDEIQTLKG